MAISDMSASPSHAAMIGYDSRWAPTRRWARRAATRTIHSTAIHSTDEGLR